MMEFNTQFRMSLEAIIIHAGELILKERAQLCVMRKSAGDLVTSADMASEQYLIKELHALLPEASWFSEESLSPEIQSDYCWVIDPLDGTTNFAHGFPHFAVSVALTYKNIPHIGVIYDPLRNELFYAQKGKGAWLNGERMQIPTQPLERKLLLVGTSTNLWARGSKKYAFRYTGSVALDCAYVACGRADGLFFVDLPWWDVAAGILLVQEAGGQVTGTGIAPEMGSLYPLLIAGSTTMVKDLKPFIA